MEGKENMSKGSKYDEETFTRYWKNDIEGWLINELNLFFFLE